MSDKVYKIYKSTTGNTFLDEDIADQVNNYCIGLKKDSELAFQDWTVGITNDPQYKTGENFKSWNCLQYKVASHTKKFLIDKKYMVNGNNTENEDETIIYVYQ